jgi:hypothetical protein
MGRVVSKTLQIIKESIIKHMTTILSIGNGLVSQITLHLDNSQDLLVLNLLQLGLGEFAILDLFTGLEDRAGTLKRANVLGAERGRQGTVVSGN